MDQQASQKIAKGILQHLSDVLKGLAIFLPGIIFCLLGWLAFVKLPVGQDVILQNMEQHQWGGFAFTLAFFYWTFTTWYTSRLIAYNYQEQYERSKWIMTHVPRLLAYTLFLIVWYALYNLGQALRSEALQQPPRKGGWLPTLVIVLDFVIYFVIEHYLGQERVKAILQTQGGKKKIRQIHQWAWIAIVLSAAAIIIFWKPANALGLCWLLLLMQWPFAVMIALRRPSNKPAFVTYAEQATANTSEQAVHPGTLKRKQWLTFAIKRLLGALGLLHYIRNYFSFILKPVLEKHRTTPGTSEQDNPAAVNTPIDKEAQIRGMEWKYFVAYHAAALIAFGCYIACIALPQAARAFTSLFVAIMALALLLALGNSLSLFSKRLQINLHFFVISLIIVAGIFLPDPHEVQLINKPNNYAQRISLDAYTQHFVKNNGADIDAADDTDGFPVFIVLADGGASRSGLWAAAILNRLHEQCDAIEPGLFRKRLFALSGASGGGVGNTCFAAQLLAEDTRPEEKKKQLSRKLLQQDYLSFLLARMFSTDLLNSLSPLHDRGYALEQSFEINSAQDSVLAGYMKEDFNALFIDTLNKKAPLPILFNNVTRVQDAKPCVISNISLSKSTGLTNREDLLDILCSTSSMRVSTAMILGARFPYFSPAGKISNQYFVDGGYFDNSGAGIVHEMLQYIRNIRNTTADTIYRKRLNKINFHVLHIANEPTATKPFEAIHPLVNNLAVPIQTLVSSFSSQTKINDRRLRSLLINVNGSKTNQEFYHYANLYSADWESYPMNWLISKHKQQQMLQKADTATVVNKLIELLKANKPIEMNSAF